MDFVEGLPKSEGKEIIMVVVDRFTKYNHFIGLSHTYKARTVAKEFMNHNCKLHGVPESIVSDRDAIFVSTFWQELFKALGTELKLSTPYHPQTDGQSERVNASLETYLRCMVGHKSRNWAQWLGLAEWWFNAHYHSRLGMSPFKALYGYEPSHQGFHLDHPGRIESVEDYMQQRAVMWDIIEEILDLAQNNKKRSERQFEEGDWVYLKEKVGNTQVPIYDLPYANLDGQFKVESERILDRRVVKRNNKANLQLKIHWTNSLPSDNMVGL